MTAALPVTWAPSPLLIADSLLNAQRMYRRLLEAFDAMDIGATHPEIESSGFVEDLDVFATTTDVNGLPVY